MPHTAASRARCNEKRAAARRSVKWTEMFIGHLPDLMWRFHMYHITKMEVKTATATLKVRVMPTNQVGIVQRQIENQKVKGVTLRLYRSRPYGGSEYMDIYIPFQGPKYGITCSAWGTQSKSNFYTNFLVDYMDRMFVETAHSLLMARMKEELIAAVWHPRRVAVWLEMGGWNPIENIAGEEQMEY